MKNIFKAGALFALMSTAACATMTRGTSEDFVVETTPANAQVALSNGMACDATPCTFDVPRKGEFSATISKDGYESVTQSIYTEVSSGGRNAMFGNILVGGVIGVGVDATSGAMLDHRPNPLVVTLVEMSDTVEAVIEEVVEVMEPIGEAAEIVAETVDTVTETIEAPVEAAEETVEEVVEETVS